MTGWVARSRGERRLKKERRSVAAYVERVIKVKDLQFSPAAPHQQPRTPFFGKRRQMINKEAKRLSKPRAASQTSTDFCKI